MKNYLLVVRGAVGQLPLLRRTTPLRAAKLFCVWNWGAEVLFLHQGDFRPLPWPHRWGLAGTTGFPFGSCSEYVLLFHPFCTISRLTTSQSTVPTAILQCPVLQVFTTFIYGLIYLWNNNVEHLSTICRPLVNITILSFSDVHLISLWTAAVALLFPFHKSTPNAIHFPKH